MELLLQKLRVAYQQAKNEQPGLDPQLEEIILYPHSHELQFIFQKQEE